MAERAVLEGSDNWTVVHFMIHYCHCTDQELSHIECWAGLVGNLIGAVCIVNVDLFGEVLWILVFHSCKQLSVFFEKVKSLYQGLLHDIK